MNGPNRKRNARIRVIAEQEWGVWVWELPNGGILSDDEGNVLNMPGLKDDIICMMQMRAAAKSYGFPEGKPVFKPGHHRISQSEWEDSMEEILDGKVSHNDYDAFKEEAIKVYKRKYTNG